jgi:hypothetical protein
MGTDLGVLARWPCAKTRFTIRITPRLFCIPYLFPTQWLATNLGWLYEKHDHRAALPACSSLVTPSSTKLSGSLQNKSIKIYYNSMG